jgi:hypothetical protein
VFANRLLRRIFGPKVGDVKGGCRNLFNEEFHNFCSSPSIIKMIKSRRMRWAGIVARMEKRNAYMIFVGKPEGKRPLGRPRYRWADSIKMDLRVIGWDCVEWIDMDHGRDQQRALVNMVFNRRVP